MQYISCAVYWKTLEPKTTEYTMSKPVDKTKLFKITKKDVIIK